MPGDCADPAGRQHGCPPPERSTRLGAPSPVLPGVPPQRLTWGSGVSWALLTLAGGLRCEDGREGDPGCLSLGSPPCWPTPPRQGSRSGGGRGHARAPSRHAAPQTLCLGVRPQPAHSCPEDGLCCPRRPEHGDTSRLGSTTEIPSPSPFGLRRPESKSRSGRDRLLPGLLPASGPLCGVLAPRLCSVPRSSHGLVPVCPRLLCSITGLKP